jgi:hypothetical protein
MVNDVRMPVVVAAGVAIFVIAIFAVRLAYGAATHQEKPRVLVLGDSITDRSQASLNEELGASYSLSIDGKASFRIGEQLPSAQRWATRSFDQVVINLGTNDAVQGGSMRQSGADLGTIVAQFPEARCVHLVTVTEDIPAEASPAAAGRAALINQRMREIASGDARVRVLDWSAVVHAELERGGAPTLDGVHPTEEGHQMLADLYSASIRNCPD